MTLDPALHRHLPELVQLDAIMDRGSRWLRCRELLRVPVAGRTLPVWQLELGSRHPQAPVLGIFGGVHGVERIGAQVLLAWLHSLVERLHWDDGLHRRLEQVRLLAIPIVNPGGMWLQRRSNPAGIDLMRNAPVDATGKVAFLVGGQRLGPWLPWYRGRRGDAMAPEAAALVQVVREHLQGAPFSMSLDCHSGFGRRDRIWSCYARHHAPISRIGDVHALHNLMQRTYPHLHPYLLEPQSVNYTTHGDLWDYLYDHAVARHPERVFLPFTLEMGSWLWVRKNPRQMFDFTGYFNPVISHRHHRVLRQHMPLLEFLLAASAHWERWLPYGRAAEQHHRDALARWFARPSQHYPPAQ